MDELDRLGFGRRKRASGGSMADVLELSSPLRELVTWMMRRDRCDLSDVAAYLEEDESRARRLVDDLVDRGFVTRVEASGGERYQARPDIRSQRRLPPNLWRALDDLGES
ncbi:MAG TPA: hypothetical protein VD789_08720 [Thermomicrobiales bacterium]|jgi:predicted transcriptional regulator|nr:hypothetical protein [Thermomicrobiales bacterium]